jgi:PPOX class probable F420-dependent enzyme
MKAIDRTFGKARACNLTRNRGMARLCLLAITSGSAASTANVGRWAHLRKSVGPVRMADERELRFLESCRVAHLATADARGVPHVVPVCFVMSGDTLYITIDEKPKRQPAIGMKRLRNISENPAVSVVADRYDEDWTRLGWVLLRGRAEILADGAEHDAAQAMLRERYSQLNAMNIESRPVIAVRIEHTTSWGKLD